MTDGEVKQVRGVNGRRYSKIRGPRITIIIDIASVQVVWKSNVE